MFMKPRFPSFTILFLGAFGFGLYSGCTQQSGFDTCMESVYEYEDAATACGALPEADQRECIDNNEVGRITRADCESAYE